MREDFTVGKLYSLNMIGANDRKTLLILGNMLKRFSCRDDFEALTSEISGMTPKAIVEELGAELAANPEKSAPDAVKDMIKKVKKNLSGISFGEE
jgi:hypothetical protein